MPRNYNPDEQSIIKQRFAEYARDDAWIRDFLAQAQIGRIATRWDDHQFITPTTFWYDPDRHEIYFHSNVVGRIRANADRHPRIAFETSESGRKLPSNIALEFSIQYRSVVAFGKVRIVEDADEQRRILNGLLQKYFGEMSAGEDYRPITDKELRHTSVYAISIKQWSGKENWEDRADQSDEWPTLNEKWFDHY